MTTPLTPNEVKVLHAFNFWDVLSVSDIFKRWQSNKTFVKYGSIHYCIYRLKERGLITEEGKWKRKLAQRKRNIIKEVKAPEIDHIKEFMHAAEDQIRKGKTWTATVYYARDPLLPTNGKLEEIEPAMVKKVEQDFNWLQNMVYVLFTWLFIVTVVLLNFFINA